MAVILNVIKAVVKVVEDVAEVVVGVVEDVVEFAVEEIIKPVVKVVDTVVTAVIEDPVATILTVAAAVTPGMQWTIPLIQGADTLAKGGSFEDALKSVAIGYVAPVAGNYVSGAVTSATGSVIAGKVAGATASGVVKGKSLKDALISGAVPEIASASLDVVKNNIPNYDAISSPGADSAITKGISKYIESGGDVTEAALAAASTNLGTVLTDNTNFNADISNALSAGLIAGLKDPEAALPAFKTSLNAVGTRDLNAKIDDYFYDSPEEAKEKDRIKELKSAETKADATRLIAESDEAAKVTGPSSVATAEEEMGAPIERSEDLETLLANYRDTSAEDFAISDDKTWEEIKFADTSDLGKAFTSGTDPLGRETAFDDSKNVDVATTDDDLTGLLSEDKEIKTSPLGGADAIARKNLIDAGKESGDFRDLAKFEDSFADINAPTKKDDSIDISNFQPNQFPEPDRRRLEDEIDRRAAAGEAGDYVSAMSDQPPNMTEATADADLKEAVQTAKTNLAAIGLNVASGTLEAVALQVEGTANITDKFLSQMSPALGEEIRKVWAGGTVGLDRPSDKIAAEKAGITLKEYRAKKASGTEYAGLSNNEKRAKVDELTSDYVDANPSKWFKNATSGAVMWLDEASEFVKDEVNDDLLLRQLHALPREGMTFTEALPGATDDPGSDGFLAKRYGTDIALDRLGRPYGYDKFATFLNASEEFGDVATDILISSIPYVGKALTVALGLAEGQAAAQRGIEISTAAALKNGQLEDNVAWQQMLVDAGGDQAKAMEKLNNSFFKATMAAGSLEGVGDLLVAKTAIKTMGLKTIKDIQTKLSPKLKRALGITGSIGVATTVGGLTEAGQEAITEKALRDFGIDPKSEVGAAFLLGAAGQGGAVSIAATASGITDSLKRKYKKGELSKKSYDFINREVIDPEGSAYDPDFVTVDERRKADVAFKTAEETRLEPGSLDPAFEAAGVSPANLSPTTIAELESKGVSPASLSPTEIAELEAAGVSPAGVTADKKTITIEELADADINLERDFADLEGEYSFTTARGSEYKVNNKGKGIRNRFNEEANKYKLETETQKTIFMEANRATDAFQSKFQYGKDPLQFIPSEVAGKGKLVYTKDYTDKDGVFHVEGSEDELIGDLDYSLVPEVGMIPIDIYDSKNEAKNPNPEAGGAAAGIHFGNKITSLGTDNFKSSITTNEVMKTFYPDLDTKPEADDVSSIIGDSEAQPGSELDILTEGGVPSWVNAPPAGSMQGAATQKLTNPATGEIYIAPSTGYTINTDNISGDGLDNFGPGEVDPRIPDFGDTDSGLDNFGPGGIDPRIVADIIGGDPENVTSDDIDAVTETIEAIEAEINTDTTVSPVISVNTDLPDEEDEERRRRRRRQQQLFLQQQEEVNDPNLTNIDYLYDFESKFATLQQAEKFDLNAGKFNRPYDLADIIATGEQLEPQKPTANDDFLQLIAAAKMNPELIDQETRGLNLFPVDETEKIGIDSPYTTESKDDTTQRLLNLINSNKA